MQVDQVCSPRAVVWIVMFTYTLRSCSTLFNNKRRGRSLACTHTGCSWRAHQIKLRQTTFYGLAISTVHAIHITHQTDAHTRAHTLNIWMFCVQNGCACVQKCVCFQCKHTAILPDQTLVCSWHGLLGYDTSRERKRTQ